MQIADRCGPWKISSGAENSSLQALQFQLAGLCHRFPGGTGMTLELTISLSYKIPLSLARSNGRWRCCAPRWLTRRPVARKLAIGIKLLCGSYPHHLTKDYRLWPSKDRPGLSPERAPKQDRTATIIQLTRYCEWMNVNRNVSLIPTSPLRGDGCSGAEAWKGSGSGHWTV
jgi:hypothetical protein